MKVIFWNRNKICTKICKNNRRIKKILTTIFSNTQENFIEINKVYTQMKYKYFDYIYIYDDGLILYVILNIHLLNLDYNYVLVFIKYK